MDIPPAKLSISRILKKILKNDWNGGGIVVTVDPIAKARDRESYLPRYLLEKEGFDLLNPFIPVRCEGYNESELGSCLDYYEERKWTTFPPAKTEQGRKELKFISGSNPYDLQRLTAVW